VKTLGIVFAALVLVAPPLTREAQPVGASAGVSISGQVTDAATGHALSAAQVVLEGQLQGALTNAAGRYVITLGDSWAGREVTVRAQLVGFTAASRTVKLTAGANVVDLALMAAPLALNEIVVTGRAQDAAKQVSPELASKVSAVSGAAAPWPGGVTFRRAREDFNTESYATIDENGWKAATAEPLSTFSIDVDRASYANVRRFIRQGTLPPVDAVRIEELVNYFTYDDPEPKGDVPFSINTEVAPAPWQPLHRLVRIGLKGRSVDLKDIPPSNLVFLVDVSGSMQPPDKLPLLKTALGMLVDEIRPQDRVAIVVYAGAAGLVLPSTPGSHKRAIRDALANLEAGGSTAGGAGIKLAYQIAAENHIDGGNNRVILATDGDFNVGASSDAEMVRLIESRRDQGTFLTVLGFGTGNLKDSKMEQLADRGNGNFAYIDNALEARKVLVHEMGGTLLTIAKDVKVQVEFNPTRVAAYRLIGYENRLLAAEDFADDRKDAGEMGAGHSVTALYEVIPVGVHSPVEVRGVDTLRYQRSTTARSAATDSNELLFVKLRYKEPDGNTSRLLTHPVADRTGRASENLRFASAVAAWGMILRGSEQCGDFTVDDVEKLARSALGGDRQGYRAEFVSLLAATRGMDVADRRPGS